MLKIKQNLIVICFFVIIALLFAITLVSAVDLSADVTAEAADEAVESWNVGAVTETDAVAYLYRASTYSDDAPAYDLVIEGTGAMADFADATYVPYYSYVGSICGLRLGDGITYLGDYAFANLVITDLVVPSTVTEIGDFTFMDATISNVDIGLSSLEVIGTGSFFGVKSLEGIVFPRTLKVIGDSAFQGVSALSYVNFNGGLEAIKALAFSQTALTYVNIPSTTVTLGEFAFNLPTLNSINFILEANGESSLTEIAANAFRDTSAAYVTLPSSVSRIGNHAFYGGSQAMNLTIYNHEAVIGDFIAPKDSVLYGHLGSTAEKYVESADGYYTFYNICTFDDDFDAICNECGYERFIECFDVSSISGEDWVYLTVYKASGYTDEAPKYDYVLSGSGYMADYSSFASLPYRAYASAEGSLTVIDGVYGLGSYSFYTFNITSINIADSAVGEIGEYAFADTAIGEIGLPVTISSIGDSAFLGTRITSVILPNSLNTLGENAFATREPLTISLPENFDLEYPSGAVAPVGSTLEGHLISTTITYAQEYGYNFVEICTYGDWQQLTVPDCINVQIEETHCTRCGNSIIREVGTPLGHDFSESPTCTEPAYCRRANCGYSEAALGHALANPTCTEDAYCTREDCNHVEEGTALGHTLANPTCTEDAYCTREDCNHVEEGTALGHALANPTCTEDAYCASEDCNHVEEGTALGHSFGTWQISVAPTQTASGRLERYCERDNCFDKEERILSALNDTDYQKAEISAPTYEREGTHTYAVTIEGQTFTFNVAVPKLEQILPDDSGIAPDGGNSTSSDGTSNDQSEANNGSITGIVIGSVAGVAVAACGVFGLIWFVVKKKSVADLLELFKKKR